MRIARKAGAALVIVALLAWPAASEPITRVLRPLLALSSPDLALLLPPDEVVVTGRLPRPEQIVSPAIPQLGAVARPSRTVFSRTGPQVRAALDAPRVMEASLKPDQVLSPRDAEPVSDVPEIEPLAVSLPTDLVTESEFEANASIAATVLSDPLIVVISLKDQKLDVYRGLERVETTRISSGKKGYDTLTGVFGILQKKREHYSNLYDNAPMPYMQRLTRSGTALHAGPVPNYPASHGCVRMPRAFAPKLYRMTEVGGKVAMMNGRMAAPKSIEHPTLFETRPTIVSSVESNVQAGTLEVARVVAGATSQSKYDPSRDDAPLHILITRREQRDIAISVQKILAAMGYLPPQDKFVGYLGEDTKKAIKAFEKDNNLPQRGRFTESIAAKIYEAAGLGPLPDAYLFVRKGFSRIRHVPIAIKDSRKKLGTHFFTYMRPSDGSKPQWIGISLEGEDSESVLDRITIPSGMRTKISKGLTSGATFIVADKGMHSSVLPEGDDFIVRTNDSPEPNSEAEKAKQIAKAVAKPRKTRAKQRVVRTRKARTKGFRLFSRRR